MDTKECTKSMTYTEGTSNTKITLIHGTETFINKRSADNEVFNAQGSTTGILESLSHGRAFLVADTLASDSKHIFPASSTTINSGCDNSKGTTN